MRIRIRPLDADPIELGISGTRFTEPDGTDHDLIDCSDLYAVPGVVDAHAHLSANSVEEMVTAGHPDPAAMAANAAAQLDAGVLLIADKGSKSDESLAMLDADPASRPELHMAGEILVVDGGYYPDFGRIVDPDQIGVAATRAAATPATWVKLIGDWPRRGHGPLSNFDEPQLRNAVAAAHAAHARVAVHTMAPGTPTAAVRAGVDSIEHGLFLTVEDVAALGARRGAWVPTVAAMEATVQGLRPGSSGRRLLSDGLDNVRSLLPTAVARGVRVMAGTDLALRHGEVAREMVRLVASGMDPADLVASAIFGAYDYFGTDHGFASGARADVVCLAADPREEPEALAEPVVVIRLGRVRVAP